MPKQILPHIEQADTQILVAMTRQFATMIAVPQLEKKATIVFEASPAWFKVAFLVAIIVWKWARSERNEEATQPA